MATDDIERLHYYQRQYLGALDFEDQQTYHRDMRRRLNLAHHTWGIVAGLELQDSNTTQPGAPTDIYISPGMAIDGYGREIVMLLPKPLDVSLFQPYRTVTRKWTICLEYIENYSQRPRSGYEQCCDVTNQFGRVQESFRIVLADPNPYRDALSVAGNAVQGPTLALDTAVISVPPYPEDQPILPKTSTGNVIAPYDESLPYQEFPIDDPATLQVARWLVPLGDVLWDGTQQSLVHDDTDPPIHGIGRHYIGAVASRLLAPARTLIMRDRSAMLPFRAATELKRIPRLPFRFPSESEGVKMVVEGTLEVNRALQVDGVLYSEDTIQLDGGGLDFRDGGGTSDGKKETVKPLFTVTRQGIDTDTGIDLLFKIGKDQAGHNRFVVGAATDLFTIADNGNAHLAGSMDNLSITGTLNFGSQPRQMITLWTSPKKQINGIGIQVDASSPDVATTYFRSSNDFYWFKGGNHSDLPGDPGNLDGANGKWLMKLDDVGGLNINGPLTINGSLTFNGPLAVNGSLTVAGPLNVTGNTTLTGPTAVKGSLDVSGGNTTLAGLATVNDLTVNGLLDVKGNTNLTGPTSVNDLTINGLLDVKQSLHMSKSNGAANFNTGTHTPNKYDVVVLDNNPNSINVSQSQNHMDTSVVGVAIDPSDAGFTLPDPSNPLPPNSTCVVLMGIVQCHVDSTTTNGNGDINVGDLLTTSQTPGHAQKADRGTISKGAVFGKALMPFPAPTPGTSGTGIISVLLMLS